MTRSHCPYCALQCGIALEGLPLRLEGDPDFPVNAGALCVKGWTAASLLDHPERLTRPLVRRRKGGALLPGTWPEALTRIASALRDTQRRHGPNAVGLFGGGSLTNEKVYLLGKLARFALRTANIDYNGRFCMSSGASAGNKAFGVDRGLPFPLADIPLAETVLLVGANPAETMPPLMRYFDEQRRAGGSLITVDPRRSATAEASALHLSLSPGSDTALANGILHVLVRERLLDLEYVAARTEGFEAVRAVVAGYWPERVERLTGVPQAQIEEAARRLGRSRTAMILTARGPEQQAQGVANVLAYVNVALALGLPGRPGSGYGTVTGQGNGQGGREQGQKADQLPGYRRIDDPAARAHIARVWGMAPAEIPGPGLSAYELLDSLGTKRGVRSLLVMGSNPVVSAPRASHVTERLRSLDFLVVADFFLSETAELADVVLPSAQWAEEDGTTTNLEGRVIRRRAARLPPAGVRTDVEILCALGRAMGPAEAFNFAGPRDVFDELRRATAGGTADYSGINYDRIDREGGVFWPCPSEAHPGTPRLFADSFPTPTGRARFHAVEHTGPAEKVDAAYPLHLTTGRVLAQYLSGTQTRRVPELNAVTAGPQAEMNPVLARQHGLGEGDVVRLATRRGSATFRVRLAPGIRPDTVFVPFHWGGERSANRLTNPALDPTSRMPEFKVCALRIESVGALRIEPTASPGGAL
jgi:assimilatory nitrate reductase catalytic subunit